MSVVVALQSWSGRDAAELRQAITPPCDALGDEAYDVMLAVVFRDLVSLSTITERACRIQTAIDVNRPMVDYCRARGTGDNARRIEATIAVLERWQSEILDGAVSGRAA